MGKLRFLLQGVVLRTVKGYCQPLYPKTVFQHLFVRADESVRWDGKSFDRFTRVSSETLKNEEGQEGLLSARDRGYRCFDKRDSTLERKERG